MADTAALAAVTFHLSLNTANLNRAVEFGRILFGQEPAKRHDDYAKFEIEDPAVILSLVPQTPATGTPRGQFGIAVDDPAALAALRSRLEKAQVVFHPRGNDAGELAAIDVADPDGNNWRFARAAAADAPIPTPMPMLTPALTMADAAEPVVWEHCVTHPLPERIPFDGSAAEIRLTGSFNAANLTDRCEWLVGEAYRALKPGGKIVLHGLMADRALPGPPPKLPGLGAMVTRVPPLAEPLAILTKAGFVDLQLVKLTETPWFVHDGIGLREMKLVARRPERAVKATRFVQYKGPFAEFVDDQGQTYRRGERVLVSTARWEAMRKGGAGENFKFIEPERQGLLCTLIERRRRMQTLEQVARFTLALPVSDVAKSMRFYRILLQRSPVSHDSNAAIFETDEPPLRLRLTAGGRPGGTVNHLGLRWPDSPAIVAVQRRLEENGFATQRQDGVECCYARQTKFWITDPDGHLIEIYILEEDIDHSGFEDGPDTKRVANRPQTIWQHRLFDAVPSRIAAEDRSVDVVELEGTFNADLSAESLRHLLAEAGRVLKPGGRVVVNAMVSDVSPESVPTFPGIAGAVQRIRTQAETVATLRDAGFASLHYDTLDDIVCIGIAGIRLFHLRLLAFPDGPATPRDHAVLYKGPAARVRDDDGTWLPRGEVVPVSAAAWERLRNGPAAAQFLFLPAD